MRILEIVDDREKSRQQERQWVRRYLAQGIQLTNVRLTTTPKESTTNLEQRIEDAISAKEGQRQLGISRERFQILVGRGVIRRVGYRLYKRSDVDRLEEETQIFMVKEEKHRQQWLNFVEKHVNRADPPLKGYSPPVL